MNVIDYLHKFYNNYEGEKGYIGFTENNQPIPYFAENKSDYPVIIVQYAIHAREYITTYLALKQIKDYIKNGKFGRIYFIPMVNIDGVKICLNGKHFYKANAKKVDLNVNFDARWGKGEFNLKKPADENYIGEFPFSESESRALRDFTLLVRPDLTISYHSKGEEIYWKFFQDECRLLRDFAIAKVVSNSTGYKLKDTYNSVGGYKDWCIEKLRIPSFTIEVGDDNLTHPIEKENLKQIYEKNKNVLTDITEYFNND
ncbi:MAG: hypothetical protein MJ066_01325 [Clostridia bacterium]|nr:hypothetical protein [Clostridia bacterium]